MRPPLFTRVRGRIVLRSTDAGSRIADRPGAYTSPERRRMCVAVACTLRHGWMNMRVLGCSGAPRARADRPLGNAPRQRSLGVLGRWPLPSSHHRPSEKGPASEPYRARPATQSFANLLSVPSWATVDRGYARANDNALSSRSGADPCRSFGCSSPRAVWSAPAPWPLFTEPRSRTFGGRQGASGRSPNECRPRASASSGERTRAISEALSHSSQRIATSAPPRPGGSRARRPPSARAPRSRSRGR
jgi:hypothetical protein